MLKAKKSLSPRVKKRQLKEDQFITKIFEFYDLGVKYQKQLFYVLIAIVAVIALSYWVAQDRAASEQNAAVELARGKAAYNAGRYDEAVDILTALSQNYDGTTSAGTGTIFLAKSYYEKQDYTNMEKYFNMYLDEYNDDVLLAVTAIRGLAVSYDERSDFEKAAAIYADGAKEYNDSYNEPLFLLDAAKCYLAAGNTTAATPLLDKVVADYASNAAAQEAKQLLAENVQ
ncbi:MAG: hypothetical protein DWQ10_11655 [Calditrichaeota bacterium]|nr:MAG: hypothetical protein DWQ10_11655 [Calditrichota bacterium]